MPGAAVGGWLADRWARRTGGGRIRTQSLGLLVAAPFVLLSGWSSSVALLLIGLGGAGLCKGMYDANIFASLFDVVPAADRGTAAGLMNTVGWAGGLISPIAVGFASEHLGLGTAVAFDRGRLSARRPARARGGAGGRPEVVEARRFRRSPPVEELP